MRRRTELERWKSDDFDQQLADREAGVEDQKQQAAEAAADVIDGTPDFCKTLHKELAPLTSRSSLRKLPSFKGALAAELPRLQGKGQPVPEGADLDELAENIAFTCGSFNPQTAAAGLRNPDTPTGQIEP